jgi:ATP-binding cassette, subfamily B, bacterial
MWGGVGVSEEDKLDRSGTKKVLRRSLRRLSPYRREVVTAGLLVLLSTVLALAGPTIVRHGIDRGLLHPNRGVLWRSVAAYLAVTIASFFLSKRLIMSVAKLGEGFLRDLRTGVFHHLSGQSLSFFDTEKAGVLVARMTSDIDSMGELVQFGLLQFVANIFLLIFTIVVLALMSLPLLGVCLVAFPFVVAASIRFQRQSNRAYLTIRERVGSNLSRLQEGITGVRVIQAYDRGDVQTERFVDSNQALFDAHMHSVRISAWYFPIVEFAGAVSTATVIGFGGWLVHRGSVSVGTIAAFVLLLGNLFEPIQQLSQLFNTVQASGASLNKLYTLLDTVPAVSEASAAIDLPARGDLHVNNVSFSYNVDGATVLDDVSLTIADGERIAFVGPTGAGKSTLAKLVARLYDPTSGTITFGSTDLRSATLASLRERIAVVPQEGFLFAGSLRDNVRVGRPEASEGDVDAALARLGLLERFAALPEGLDTLVMERGTRLSAGERQLVSLARAALADPAVLVLDEATSNLDPGTESLVEAALDGLLDDRTVIVIAHRLTTAARCDRIAVVDGGRLVELGSHDDLVALGGKYATLYAAWVGTSMETAANSVEK